MPKVYNDQGEEILEIEDIEKAKEILSGHEESSKAHEELKTQYEEAKEKLGKLESKDFNFRKFEKATEEEKAKLMEKMTDQEKTFTEELSSLKSRIDTGEKTKIDTTKEKALTGLAGDDEELKKKLTEAFDKSIEFGGQPKDKEDVITRMQSAYTFVTGTRPSVSALNSFAPNTAVFEKQEKTFDKTDKGAQILHQINPTLYPLKKENK